MFFAFILDNLSGLSDCSHAFIVVKSIYLSTLYHQSFGFDISEEEWDINLFSD